MTIRLLYFAWVRERIGAGQEELAAPSTPLTVAALLELLAARSAGHGAALADRGAIRVALNEAFVEDSALVQPGDEVAIFPPVTGG